jgi:hypothetical protein
MGHAGMVGLLRQNAIQDFRGPLLIGVSFCRCEAPRLIARLYSVGPILMNWQTRTAAHDLKTPTDTSRIYPKNN